MTPLTWKQTSSSSKILTQKFFETYKSPLKLYRKYRFHPDYSQHVAGGYRSKTYSNRIDPLVPLCAFETSGGACNDNDCPNQHERDFTIKGASLDADLFHTFSTPLGVILCPNSIIHSNSCPFVYSMDADLAH